MKKIIIVLFILSFTGPSLAATVGGPDISIPEESLCQKEKAVEMTLDRLEYNMNLKASVDIEIITKRKLASSFEVTNAKIKGQHYMVKISNNFGNIFEPYIKIGTSNLKVKWNQNNQSISVEAEPGFVWGIGAKAKLWESRYNGVLLTLDAQYRDIDLDVDSTSISDSTDKKFEIEQWQMSLLASKKFVLPVGMKDYYIVPYTGLTYSSIDVDVRFTQTSNGLLFSTYNASDENIFGIVLGCDIMPSLLSWYLLNFELRLINETAFTLGGTVKF